MFNNWKQYGTNIITRNQLSIRVQNRLIVVLQKMLENAELSEEGQIGKG